MGKSLFSIYVLHRILTGDYPHLTSVVYRQSTKTRHRVWAYERIATHGVWGKIDATTSLEIPSLFIYDNSLAESATSMSWIDDTKNILITSPRLKALDGINKGEEEARFLIMPLWSEEELCAAAGRLRLIVLTSKEIHK